MRPLVFLLVLGNIIVFALSAGWISGGDQSVAVATESHQPLSPDRIRIVSRGDPPSQPVAQQCLEWRDISAGQVAELEKLAASNRDLAFIREETQAASVRHWVYIPGLKGGRVASDKKAAELKPLGVSDYQLVQQGVTDLWNISLGIYSSEAAAAEALADFKKMGVRSAQAALRSETPARYRMRPSGLPAALGPLRKPASLPAPFECPAEKTIAVADSADVVPAAASPAEGLPAAAAQLLSGTAATPSAAAEAAKSPDIARP